MVNPITIIMVGYIMSFAFLGGQSVIGDLVGIDMQAFDPLTGGFTGQTMKNAITSDTDTFSGCYDTSLVLIGGFDNQTYETEALCIASLDPVTGLATNTWVEGTGGSFSEMSFQTAQMQITMASEPSVTSNPLTSAATITYQLFQVLTGTYVFNILTFMGIPQIFVVGITMVYVLSLAIWVINMLRGNNPMS
jgi:hypothetical protein